MERETEFRVFLYFDRRSKLPIVPSFLSGNQAKYTRVRCLHPQSLCP